MTQDEFRKEVSEFLDKLPKGSRVLIGAILDPDACQLALAGNVSRDKISEFCGLIAMANQIHLNQTGIPNPSDN